MILLNEYKKEENIELTTHMLAKILLENEDLPVSTHSNNHTHIPEKYNKTKVGILITTNSKMICIGNFFETNLNFPNWYISEILY